MDTYAVQQFRAYTTKNGHKRLDETLELCAELYNKSLEERRDAWSMFRIKIRYLDQTRWFTKTRQTTPEWENLELRVGRGVLKRVDRAFVGFFRRTQASKKPGFPRFKSPHRYRCIELAEVRPGMINYSKDNRHVYIRVKGLPVLRLRARRTLPLLGWIKGLRIIKRPTGWYVDLSYITNKEPLESNGESVGIDAGVNKRLTMSNGEVVPRRNVDRNREESLQREADKANKGSYKQRQLRHTLACYRYREHVKNRNECHRWTTYIIRKFEFIGIEKLRLLVMTASASGTLENPGINVAQKSGLNRSIREQTLGMLRDQLRYKAEWADRVLIEVDPAYTSQTCSRCGERRSGKWRRYSVFECDHCGLIIDRDLNAAINILERALNLFLGPESLPLLPDNINDGLPTLSR